MSEQRDQYTYVSRITYTVYRYTLYIYLYIAHIYYGVEACTCIAGMNTIMAVQHKCAHTSILTHKHTIPHPIPTFLTRFLHICTHTHTYTHTHFLPHSNPPAAPRVSKGGGAAEVQLELNEPPPPLAIEGKPPHTPSPLAAAGPTAVGGACRSWKEKACCWLQ
jgi:hypothetical protein